MNPDMADPDASDPAGEAVDPVEASPPGEAAPGASRQAVLPQPLITARGSTAATVSPDGTAVQIDGGLEPASYAIVSYRIATGAMNATAAFTVTPAAGASFEYLLTGTGGGYSSRHLKLSRIPGSDALRANTTSGAVECGTLPSGQPTRVTLAFDGAAKTFDVLIGGARSACSQLSTKAAGPVIGFRLNDAAVQDYGGHVEFSGLTLLY